MVQVRQLEADVSVAGQLTEADFAEVAARGFRAVVNNRPDGETPDQLPSGDAEAAAARAGLAYRFHPVTHPQAASDEASVAAFAKAVEELPHPVLFYCRSGSRCTTLWGRAAAARLGVELTMAIAAEAGYDLEVFRDELEKRAGGKG